MGKMPEGLRRYWANKRRKGRKVITKTRTVVKTARKYFGRKRRGSGKKNFPLMAIPVIAAVASVPVLGKAPHFGDQSAFASIMNGDWKAAGGRALDAAAQPVNYVPVVATVLLWGLTKVCIGSRKITRGVSVA